MATGPGATAPMPPGFRAWLGAALSFTVYLIPLVGPHAFWLLGESIVRGVTRGERPAPWIASEVAVAILLQVLAGLVWFWIAGRPRSLRPLVLVVAVPAVVVTANWIFLLALPTRFLIDKDTAPEQRAWSVACSLPGDTIVTIGRKPSVVRPGGDVVHVQDVSGRLAKLAVIGLTTNQPTCRPIPLAMPPPTAMLAPAAVTPAGVLFHRIAAGAGESSWEWLAAGTDAPVPVEPPVGWRRNDGAPVVSPEGRTIAWPVPVVGSGQPPDRVIVVRALVVRPSAGQASAATERTPDGRPIPPAEPVRRREDTLIRLDRVTRGGLVLLDLDRNAREVMVAIDERRFAALDFDGEVRWGPVRPEDVDPLSMTLRRVGDGWVAWDGYKEKDGYVLSWTLPQGRGRHQILRGRGITDVAVDPGGRFVAVSVTTSLSIGDVRDAVFVIRTADGAEVFRRYLPRYARSNVSFPARDLFAYTEWDGTRTEVVVLRVPPG